MDDFYFTTIFVGASWTLQAAPPSTSVAVLLLPPFQSIFPDLYFDQKDPQSELLLISNCTSLTTSKAVSFSLILHSSRKRREKKGKGICLLCFFLFIVLLAMIFIWSCWLPFESGTALSLNYKAVMAFCVANLSAASGSLTWCLLTCKFGQSRQLVYKVT